MKLQNKKTGEIGYLYEHSLVQDIIIVYDVKGIVGKYNSLAELNKDWGDAPEEPITYYYISDFGAIREGDVGKFVEDEIARKEIGNYFESEEEAEKAVEKLKAWKRMKDKGFKFIGVRGIGKVIDFDIPEPFNHVGFDEYVAGVGEKEFYNDLLLLFGGEK